MTKQEAADMIRNDMRLHHDYLSGTYRKALNMAIETLIGEEKKFCTYYTKNNKKPCCTHDCDGCEWYE